jgi:2-polyprenyl-3-methyl-5-hydroxy-6-metoxy-1,4-benzoquinol methylase
MTAIASGVESRARLSLGAASDAIHAMVERMLTQGGAAGTLVDVGCGTGDLWRRLHPRFSRVIGLDAVRYDGLPHEMTFKAADLDEPLPVADALADVTTAVEVIEHLENPRALMRELVRITRPGGLVVVTTPNQLSVLSLLTLALKGSFSAFQDRDYPAHRTALLEIDLRRIAAESGLEDIRIEYSRRGRLPLTPWHYPRPIAALAPRRFSDNVALIGRCGSRS